MTDRRAPATKAGRRYALHPPGSLDEWEEAILAIEAEASVPAAPLTAEALAKALRAAEREWDGDWPDWNQDDMAAAILARLPAAPAAPQGPSDEEYAAFKRSEYERIRPAFLTAPAAPDEALRAALERLLAASEPLSDGRRGVEWRIGPGNEFTEAREQARAALAARSAKEEA